MDKKVSVIIPTHGDRSLGKTIESLHNSTYKNIELIIVKEGYERSRQRNIGWARSTGKYLLFLDSDMTVFKTLIEDCVILSESFDGLYIPEVIVNHPIKTSIRLKYTKSRVDAIRFLKREYFIPFDETITGWEDWDFDRRFQGLKGKAHICLYHHAKTNIPKKLYYCKWLLRYIKKHPDSLLYELNPFYRLWLILKR